ncbi:PTPRF-like protein, partial [Mya arenaria]
MEVRNGLLEIVLFVAFGFCLCGGTKCGSNCLDCDTSGASGSCLQCDDGFYTSGFNCIPCSYAKCQTCSKALHCDTCPDGFWGDICTAKCADGCIDGKCNTNNGSCSCRKNFYGNKCDGKCSDACEPMTCFGDSGNCACKQGYFGASCRSKCGNYCADGEHENRMRNTQTVLVTNITQSDLFLKEIIKRKHHHRHQDIVLPDLDEERRTQKRKLAKKVEENVYYIRLQDIEKRKVKVEEMAAFVDEKTLAYYEEEFDKFSDGLTRSCDVAKLPLNRAKNRYKGLYAYDDTRVKVTGFDTDYINANYIDGFKERNAYIASLGPMSKQMGDFGMFWNMIWQQKVEKIVMVTNLMEDGKEKCEQYWPNVGITINYSGVMVTCQSENEYADFTRRLLLLNDGKSERQLHHLHFTAWPDRGIPEDVTALIEFRHRVLHSPALLGGPTLVHCRPLLSFKKEPFESVAERSKSI